MPGKAIKSEQVKLYMKKRKEGKTQETAGAKAGMSERSGRRAEKGELQPNKNRKRYWRTRVDPFANVWESEIVPLLVKNPLLTPITLFEKLQHDHPKEYPDSKLRTFQRRVSKWKALYGPDKEVMFRQEQVAGRIGISDFTKLKNVTITIGGESFIHLLYHFRLAYSGWCSLKVVHGGESYAALAEGLQDALWRLGGVPHEHRSDSLSAAYRNLNKDAAADVTRRYQEFCRHYDMEPTRNNRGKGHENGSIESPHGHLKKRIKQALYLRESCDFDSVSSYEEFLAGVVRSINVGKCDKVEHERQHLQPLPLHRTADYTEKVVPVSSSSTIQVKRVLYTVPSRLIGEMVRVHIYDNRLEVHLGSTLTATLPRGFVADNNRRGRQVDYRHIISSLEKKPQAFRYSQLRDDLLPDETYKAVWTWLDKETVYVNINETPSWPIYCSDELLLGLGASPRVAVLAKSVKAKPCGCALTRAALTDSSIPAEPIGADGEGTPSWFSPPAKRLLSFCGGGLIQAASGRGVGRGIFPLNRAGFFPKAATNTAERLRKTSSASW